MPDDLAFQRRPLTLAGLTELVRADMALSPATRRDRVSALNSFVKHLHLQPDRAQANVAFLRNLISDVQPAALGISSQTWANIRSNVLAAVRTHGDLRSPKWDRLTPEWKELRRRLIDQPISRGLSALIHFCSASGISAEQVDESVSQAFKRHLEEATFRRKPRHAHRSACVQWNQAVETIAGWPQRRLIVPSYREILSFPLSHFPSEFQDDLGRWQRRVGGDDLLDFDGPDNPLRPVTIAHKSRQLVLFASAVVRAGTDISTITSLSKLVERNTLLRGFEFLLGRTGGKPRPGLFELAVTLHGVAKHWCNFGIDDLTQLRKIRSKLRCRPRGMSDKNRQRLTPFKDRATRLKLHRLPLELFEAARREPHAQRAALLAQTAVMIELLIMTAVRISNLCTLQIDSHLRFHGRERDLTLIIGIPGSEVKNRVPLHFDLPAETAAMVKIYLDHHRPNLPGHHQPWLFPGRKDTHKHVVSAGEQIKKAIEKRLGHRVNPHLMRHLAALFWLDIHPGDYESLRRLMGHRSTNSLMDYYSGTEAAAAARRYDEAILAARRTSVP